MKKNQVVYFYQSTGEYQGTIIAGVVKSIIKDLTTNKVTYTVKTTKGFICEDFELSKDSIYTSRKQIEKEYKEEIIYGNLSRRLVRIESLLNDAIITVKEPIVKEDWQSLFLGDEKDKYTTLYVDAKDVKIGEMSIKEELDNLKREINSIKKKIKPKTKKPVVRE